MLSRKTILFLAVLVATMTIIHGCKKPKDEPPAEAPVDPPKEDTIPAVITDTVNYVSKLEEYYFSGQGIREKSKEYSFYYDDKNRLVQVGFKNYDQVLFDTATATFFYAGNSIRPYKIISPSIHSSDYGGPLYYDTTYFYYDGNGMLFKDSSQAYRWDHITMSYYQTPTKRTYSFPDSVTSTLQWYSSWEYNAPLHLVRIDTLVKDAKKNMTTLKMSYLLDGNIFSSYLTEMDQHSEIVNPLSKLNISGTSFSLIYQANEAEILGNDLYGSGLYGLAYYLDFVSTVIPTRFYVSDVDRSNNNLGTINVFYIEIKPWEKRPSYPSELTVMVSPSYAGDRMVYRYHYR